MKPPSRITGLVAAPFTPLLGNGQLNLPLIPAYARSLVRDRVGGAFICGTTGEGASLTTAERMRVATAWMKTRAKLKVIVHVGHNANADSCALARHAQEIRADAVATVAPGFFRPSLLGDLIDWCIPVAAAAPQLPFYFYHLPSMSGVDFPMTEFLPLAARRIPTFAGIKYTHDNLMDFGDTLALAGDRYSVLAGRDEILLSYLAIGAVGAVGSTYNYAAPIYLRLMAAHAKGDQALAQKLQALARAFVGVVHKFGGMRANKMTMNLVTGLDCGPTRAPLSNLSSAQITALRNELEATGIFAALKSVRSPKARLNSL